MAVMGDAIDLRKIASIFRRRLRLLLSVALVIFVAAAIFTMQETPLYTASANLTIDSRQENVVTSQEVLSGLKADTSVIDTEVEILRSRRLAERVVDELHLERDTEFNGEGPATGPIALTVAAIKGVVRLARPDRARTSNDEGAAPRHAAVDSVMQRTTIRRVGLTYVMTVSFTSESPEKAAQIANAFTQEYLGAQLEAKFAATVGANRWLNDRLGQLQGEVQAAEAAVSQYQIANGLLSSEGATLTEQDISAYNQQLATARATQAEEEARLRTARSQLARGSNGDDVGEALDSTVVQQLRARRAEVSGRVADLSTRYGPRHPDLLRANQELADIDQQIEAEIQRVVRNLEARAAVARERTNSVAGTLGGARRALASNSAAAVRLNELERNAESVRTVYQSFLDRYKETTAQAGIEQSDARVVSAAAVPAGRSSPNVPLNLFIGLLLAAGAGFGAVVLAEMLDTGLSTSEDVERKLGYVALGTIPLLSSVADGADRRKPAIDYVIDKPLSAFAESFRSLRASTTYSSENGAKVLSLVSSLPDEGKTTAAICLARVAAQSGARTLLIDGDLRRRGVTRALRLDATVSIFDVLAGSTPLDQAIVLDAASGAYILPTGDAGAAAGGLFGTTALDDLLARARLAFDFVVIDTAPTLAVADTRVIASKSDAVVMMVRWRKTPSRAVATALRMLEQSGVNVVGVTLSRVDMNAQMKQGYGDASYYYGDYKKYYS